MYGLGMGVENHCISFLEEIKTNVFSNSVMQSSKITITKLEAFEINSNVIFLFMKVVLLNVQTLEPHCLGLIQFCQ